MRALIIAFEAWRKRRYWQRRHFEFVRNMIMDDWRWLAEFPVANELSERYRRALYDGWYRLDHEDIRELRDRLRARHAQKEQPHPIGSPESLKPEALMQALANNLPLRTDQRSVLYSMLLARYQGVKPLPEVYKDTDGQLKVRGSPDLDAVLARELASQASSAVCQSGQVAAVAVEPDLPEGIWERGEREYLAECCGCGRDTPIYCDLKEIPAKGYRHYCGGSPRCCP